MMEPFEDESSGSSQQVSIQYKGNEIKMDIDKVHARQIERKFKLVRCHLEGDDHSAIFPNKQTGQYRKLNPKVRYTVYGHRYNENEVWTPTAKFEKGKTEINTDGSILKEGYVEMRVPTWWGFGPEKTTQFWMTVCYNKLKWYESKDAEPEGELEIEKSTRVQINQQLTNSFKVINPLEILTIIAPKHEEKEQWMNLIEAVRETELNEDDDKEEDD